MTATPTGETHVPLAAFDDPIDRAPDRHAFFEEHGGWIPWPTPI